MSKREYDELFWRMGEATVKVSSNVTVDTDITCEIVVN